MEREKEEEMSQLVNLACTVCSEDFLVSIGVYNAHSSVVLCPCCGSTDLVLLGVVEKSSARITDTAA
jgi:4-hydroxy-3-methylbut-2-en-1-yl diphosphate synthase IspG/GcpE